ncbi:hydroxymethylbilane synthase [Geobacillus sp. FSL K6-0789]|uniref:Porphobilinogen deaminase n=1 Tax=Geobacillus stearothermophilus TaxID=1422 RepID=A0A0K9HYK7_GEOSE|nr:MULTISPECIES: hydroxymethylbilane synthase [Geobacillus]KAF6510228.1 Porphobilinogen deaminase [Geobacillus stearothermophilus]KMY58195.1 porphobilinogen deaminase [Geobacillus stearothermophilus]KMY64011.1 porphobilinogen deaminase [Geobacillus stearothermophilus]KMY64333.1 porphobilinogen deaminase [Geobacillus stearothermophilus]KOR94724.1 porphobilinogen deaminase [Geobacillus stearothermophilus ATCC 12980]
MRNIVVGSRRSKLALTQTKWVINELKQLGAPFTFEVKEIVTKGDRVLDVTLSKVGGKGLFVKEIEHELLAGGIDMAVHSMKDMPAVLPEGLVIGAVPRREDARDVLVSKGNRMLSDLPPGSVIGTSSLRRSAQLLAYRPDLTIKWIRGNIDTRLAKLESEEYDAIVLAAAGLARMGWGDDVISDYLPFDVCVPAVGQGALAVECREDDDELRQWLSRLNDEQTERAVRAERAFLQQMEGGCQVPIAGYAEVKEGTVRLTALVASPDGKEMYKEIVTGADPEAVGRQAAAVLIEQGAKALIERVKQELSQS